MSNKASYNREATLVIRRATGADEAALERLAQLEGQSVPPAPILVAEVAGQIQAALSIRTGTAISDPFLPTAQLVNTLRSHARPPAAYNARVAPAEGRLVRRAPWPA